MKSLAPERSIVTILVVDTVDSTDHIAGIDPDEAEQFLDPIFRHVSGAVEEAGGMLVNFSGDGGIAVFGWPNSLEDHADRACEAAWLIQQPAHDIAPLRDFDGRPVRFRVGVHSGLVGLRQLDIGFGKRLDPVGGTVHLAAALEKRASPDGILISSRTQELCRSELALQPFDDLPVLKKINASAFRLLGRPGRPAARDMLRRYRVPLVGRRAEREILRNAQPRPGGGNRAVGIVGEPGIGKSRLVAAAVEDAQASGRPVLVFHGDSQKRTTPYAAIRSLILETLSVGDAAPDDQIKAALKNSLAGDEADNDTLGTVLFTKRSAAEGKASRLTETQVARALVGTFTTLTSGNPTLIIIEDVHLLDLESIHCLKLLAEAGSPGTRTLLLTGRPEALADITHIAGTVLRLDPLSREEMEEFARHLRSGAATPRAVLEKALDRADGIPFVLEQIILSIGSEGAESARLLPESVESVIHARLNRLSPGAKSCAQALSVLGEEVEVDLALRALGLDPETLRQNRSELEHLEIVHSSMAPAIRFRHSIVAEACSETLPGARRQEIHRAALGAITSLYADLGAQYERLAFHAEGARDDERALEYLWQAALRARRSSASGSLSLLFRRAMQCIERIGEPAEPRFVDFLLMAFDPLQQIGEFRRMSAYLPRAMELARKQGRKDKVCAALCHMGMVSWFEGRYAEGREQTEQALAIAEELNSLPLIFAAKFMLASVLHGMAHMKRAIALQRELCDMLRGKLETARLGAAGIPGSIVRSYLCWFLMETGQYEEGLAYAQRALEIAASEREPYSELLGRLGMGRNLLKLRRDRQAVECLEAARDLIVRNGYEAALPHVTGLLATALSRTGEAARAARMTRAWLESGQEQRTGQLEVYYLNAGYAEALHRLGDKTGSLAAADRAIEVGRNISNPCLIVQGLGLRAQILSEAHPGDARIEQDLSEQRDLCLRYGLVAGP